MTRTQSPTAPAAAPQTPAQPTPALRIQPALRVQSGAALLRLLVIVVVVAALAVLVYLGLQVSRGPMDFAAIGNRTVVYGTADPTGVPATLAGASLVARGEYLTRAADCEACHTSQDGVPFAGGRPFVLPFGTLYSPNITPDPDTGIGRWSDADFLQAVHRGVAPGGIRLYPAFPYASYTYLTDNDVLAIKTYLFSLAPVHAVAPANALAFPFNQRWLMGIWAALFDADKRFSPNKAMSVEWNRGAYLAEALAHCGECHTPRNLLQAQNQRRKYAGGVIGGWFAYNITQDNGTGIGAWSADEVGQYLSSGHAAGHGAAAGPMQEAVDVSLRHLTADDIQALATYVRSVPGIGSSDVPPRLAGPAPASYAQGATAGIDLRGREIYEGACVGCHAWTGISPVNPYATLVGARAVNDPSAINVVQILLGGAHRGSDPANPYMPSFQGAYSDAELAAVANYVVARFGSQASHVTAEQVAALRKQDDAPTVGPDTKPRA
jgi:mono/diheme cytochrome c family protein